MTEELKEIGLDVGHRRVGRLMRQNGISVVRTRKHKVTTDSDHKFNIAPNLLDRDFNADAPNQKWAGDISHVWTREGWLYLAVILDLHSRRVIGWAVSNRMKRDLAIRALNMAIAFRAPPKGCIHHTDRGSQYCSHDYQKLLRQHGFKVSMSGKGNCYDNAAVETFFKTIKAELIWRRSWETRRQAEVAIFEYFNGFYNPRRRHSALGWKSPVAFERKVAKTSTWGGTNTRQVQSRRRKEVGLMDQIQKFGFGSDRIRRHHEQRGGRNLRRLCDPGLFVILLRRAAFLLFGRDEREVLLVPFKRHRLPQYPGLDFTREIEAFSRTKIDVVWDGFVPVFTVAPATGGLWAFPKQGGHVFQLQQRCFQGLEIFDGAHVNPKGNQNPDPWISCAPLRHAHDFHDLCHSCSVYPKETGKDFGRRQIRVLEGMI